jgi:hypothetical protein
MTLTNQQVIDLVTNAAKLTICIHIAASFLDHEERMGIRDQLISTFLYPDEVLIPDIKK